jgi:hypothetical protein
MTDKINKSAEPPGVITQYETLRTTALGAALPPESRAGLLLFLRRGMWGWARTVATMSTFEQPSGPRPSNWKAPEEFRTVIHIFAAMAIKADYQGAAP